MATTPGPTGAGAHGPGTRVYGPVPSRRLGLSLGVDLVPLKTCTYDCLYCQLGPTRTKTLERRRFFPVDLVLEEARLGLARCRPDFVTVAGSGEPTLESRLGDVLEGLKRLSDVPVALLTNGSLFSDGEVRRAAALADVVLPSLDAGDEELFREVNRPARGLALSDVIEGLRCFRGLYRGQIWLEVMILAGISDEARRVAAIAAAATTIRPDRIQLNTPVRPGGRDVAKALAPASMEGLCGRFVPRAEVVAEFASNRGAPDPASASGASTLALLGRRPCTLAVVAAGLRVPEAAARRELLALVAAGAVRARRRAGATFFVAVPGGGARWRRR